MFQQNGDYIIQLAVSTDGIGDAVVETPFRTRTSNGTGTVNLEEATLLGSVANLSFDKDSVTLTDGGPIPDESNQGYLRSPSRWKFVG